MALFPEVSRDFAYKGKTFTNLVVSEGDAPAEKIIPAAVENNNVKFQYAFGPEGNKNVVIPKGKLLEAVGSEWDYESEHEALAVKIAEPGSKKVIGVNSHNVYQRRRDRFNGNNVTVLTRNYIEIPYVNTDGLDASGISELLHAINYGVAYGTLQPGDFVKAGKYGNFTKFTAQSIAQDGTTKDITVSGDTFDQIVGQVWAVETQLPPEGFLQYVTGMTSAEYAEMIKNASYPPSAGTVYYGQGSNKVNGAGAYGVYPEDLNNVLKPYTGLPFLTDGYLRAKTEVSGITLANTNGDYTDVHVDYASVNDSSAISISADGKVTVTDYRKAMLYIKMTDKLAAAGDGKVQIKLDGVLYADADVNPNLVHVDYVNNVIVVYFQENITGKALTVDATLIVNPVAGIPSGWDVQNSLGAVRILLMR